MSSEKQFQSAFTRWARYNLSESCACELKFIKGPSMPFNALADHQYTSLRLVKNKKLGHKISDFSPEQKPFDYFMLSGAGAYLVVMFYQERGDKEFFMIDITTLDRFISTATRKSITKDQARSIADRVGVLS